MFRGSNNLCSTDRIFDLFLGFAFPRTCLVCGKTIRDFQLCVKCAPKHNLADLSEKRCLICWSSVEHQHITKKSSSNLCERCLIGGNMFKKIRYLWIYQDQRIAKLISTMKYKPSRKILKYCEESLTKNYGIFFNNDYFDLIIPIPPNPKNIWRRGFNQSAILANIISKQYKISLLARALIRAKIVRPQASLTRLQREQNARGMFKLKYPEKIKGASILLIDDVITTGATAKAAAKTLLSNGAKDVSLYILASNERW
ncbi:MAG TPA: phosphoribosyltransferase family protein [Oligoflexia bacterium]|nr:phosphoribosyltransferase family protein [Oligoflexia bacterium]HMP26761.1 phosphoribosyltransferase family protein [Oligoflexia bacterium]